MPCSWSIRPVENIWPVIRNTKLSDRVFTSYENHADQCCDAWNEPVDQPTRIMSGGLGDWAYWF